MASAWHCERSAWHCARIALACLSLLVGIAEARGSDTTLGTLIGNVIFWTIVIVVIWGCCRVFRCGCYSEPQPGVVIQTRQERYVVPSQAAPQPAVYTTATAAPYSVYPQQPTPTIIHVAEQPAAAPYAPATGAAEAPYDLPPPSYTQAMAAK